MLRCLGRAAGLVLILSGGVCLLWTPQMGHSAALQCGLVALCCEMFAGGWVFLRA